MHNFARLVTLPIILGSFIGFANAEPVSPEKATELLAKSSTINKKCNFLSETETGELSNLVARAEISLAQQQSVSDATTALARGKSDGQSATCNDIERSEVISVLSAARTASISVKAPEMQAEPDQQAMAPTPQVQDQLQIPPIKITKLEPKNRMTPRFSKKMSVKKLYSPDTGGLASYASLTKRYYILRRCGTINARAMNALYQNVVASHKNTLKTFGRAPTAAAMRRAEAQASSQSCS